jgi:GTPase
MSESPKNATSNETQGASDDYIMIMLKQAAESAPTAAAALTVPVDQQRCGMLAIVGRPNVGKSTLINALVGQKISITSSKAQTTRHRITGIVTKGASQFVLVDTPGYQTKYSAALNKSLNKAVVGAVSDVDLVLFVVEAGKFGPADRKVLDLIDRSIPRVFVVNKLDLIHRRETLMPWLQAMQEEGDYAEVVPLSANNKKDVSRLLDICEPYLPKQAWMYAPDELTDRSEKFLAAEIVREKLFRLTGDELPYTSTVLIEKFDEEPGHAEGTRMLRISATIVVERDGHKAMVIGDGGEKIKRIGTEARHALEELLGAKVFLEVWVKVRSGWADDEARLRSFGYE